jgi:hypothetical protein
MKWLALVVLLASAFALGPDGYCNYSAGESCMNSQDCSACNVTMETTLRYFDTYALLSVRMFNFEPAELPLIAKVRKDDDVLAEKSIDIPAGGQKLLDVKIDRDPGNATVFVELRDRDIGTAWAYESMVLLGLESNWNLDVLIPIVSVLAFIGILVFGIRQMRGGKGPYFIQPVFMPAYPPEPPPEEEIIIVPKKKKYYYRK